MPHNGVPRPVTPPLMLRPWEKQRAIAKLQSTGHRIDNAATVGEIAVRICKAIWEPTPKYEAAKYALIRRYIKREEPMVKLVAYEWKEYVPDEAMRRAVARAEEYRKLPGDDRG